MLAAATFGLATGLLELLSLVIRVKLVEKGFFLRSRHFIWMVPVSDLAIFGGVGVALAVVSWSTGWLTTRRSRQNSAVLGQHEPAAPGSRTQFPGRGHFCRGSRTASGPLGRGPPPAVLVPGSLGAGVLAAVLVILIGQAITWEISGRFLAKSRSLLLPGQVPNILLIVLDTVLRRPPQSLRLWS